MEMLESQEFVLDADGMKQAITAFIGVLTTDLDPEGTVLRAFQDGRFNKPMDNTEFKHYTRITWLLRYVDIIPGEQLANLALVQKKQFFFATHPQTWRDTYYASARDFDRATVLKKSKLHAHSKDPC